MKSLKLLGLAVGAAAFAMGGAGAAGADYASTVLAQNPVGYWRFNDAVNLPPALIATNYGSVGAIGNGFAVGNPALYSVTTYPLVVSGEPGVVGTSYRFSNNPLNVSDCITKVDVPFTDALNPQGSFSIELWVKLAQLPTDLYAAISSMNADSGGRFGWVVYANGLNGASGWNFRMGSVSGSGYAVSLTGANGVLNTTSWSHLVAVYDAVASTATVYLNGAVYAAGTVSLFGANTSAELGHTGRALRIGGTGVNGTYGTVAGNRGFDGWVDEVALYATPLSASVVAAHYSAATTNAAGYDAQILASNPIGYWNLDEPAYTPPDPSTYPVAVNLGTAGPSANGVYTPGVAWSPDAPPFSGSSAGNTAIQLNGAIGSVQETNIDVVGNITLMAWVRPTLTDNLRDIVAHGYAAEEDFLRINTAQNIGAPTASSTPVYELGSWDGTTTYSVTYPVPPGDVGRWVFLAGTYDGASWRLYHDGQLVASAAADDGALSVSASWGDGMRGDPDPEDPRASGGGLAEVAIFSSALTAAQIQAIFVAGRPLPIITQPPAVNNPVYVGTTVSLSVAAVGVGPLTYQWIENGAPISGQVNPTLNLGMVSLSSSGTYGVIVSNPNGSVTNTVVLKVVAGPPFITQPLAPTTRFTGGSVTFTANAAGSPPLAYQWALGGTPIPGANGSSYTASGLTAASAGAYKVTVSNGSGSTNTSAVLTVVPVPTAAYPLAVIGDQPLSYWRLDETSGTVAHDYISGIDGAYNGVTLGVPGYGNVAGFVLDPNPGVLFPGATNADVSGISGTAINFTGSGVSFSLEAWVNGSSSQLSGAGIIAKGTGTEGGNGDEQFSLDVYNGVFRFYVREASDNTAVQVLSPIGPDGNWHHLVAVFDSVGGVMHLYTDGVDSTPTTAPASGPRPSIHPVSIGARRGGVDVAYDLYFSGTIDEVAVYPSALSAAQVQNHYGALYGSNLKPIIISEPQPAATAVFVSQQAYFTVAAIGTVPLSYQWNLNGTPIPGANSYAYTNSYVALSDAGNYTVTVSNGLGSTNSAAAKLTVLPIPTKPVPVPGLVVHLPFDGNLTDATGRGNNGYQRGSPAITYVPDGQLGKALHYQTDPYAGTNYVTLGVRPDLQFSSNVNFTVSYWIRLPLGYAGGDLPFFTTAIGSTFGPGILFAPAYGSQGTQGTQTGFDGGWALSIINATGSTTGNGGGIGVYGAEYSISDNGWHHLVHVCDRTTQVVTYLDGVVAPYTVENGSTTLAAAGNIDTGNPATIGQDPTGKYGEYGSADIDDFGVWQRALTPLEVSAIYLAGSVNQVSFTNATPPTLTLASVNGQIHLTWPTTGGLLPPTLQSADNVVGPYTDVTGATPPYPVNATKAKKFYRLRGE